MKRLIILLLGSFFLAGCSHFPGFGHPSSSDENAGESGPSYLKADRAPPSVPRLRHQCVTAHGEKVCGYDCKVVDGYAKCASKPEQRCVIDPHNSAIRCGYDCKETGLQARCGKHRYDNCATNSMGDVRCGNNCYEREDGELVCGK
ncbi:MAG: hypothetical protein COV52_05850 [Gammaproteobacteria bacterium CG11_big_fil_rev_8_21_14_0_20_46_22]|nr:MAG: hypothetical protein COW05_07810 [Gammaproteobacteria bacterium CG12_big_fil_rev_8_21_14_0_65_46_12]PIR11028.1 MAG: hypothetical protein COV52_05850 [Gammaproteobacteria bacterium CG11_big_fil_rev_8_21_14_0_20_46_22]